LQLRGQFSPLLNRSSKAHDAILAGEGRTMRRREFIGLIGGASILARTAHAQQAEAGRRIGVLWPGSTYPAPPRMNAFTLALRQLGFVEGQNLAIELRYARDGAQQLPELADELARANVDVIAAFGDLAPKIAHQKTEKTPIVAISDDILATGLVGSLSRPGGSVTGLTIMSAELSAKRLGVLHQMIPKMSRVAALWDPTTGASQVVATEGAAKTLGLDLQVLEVRNYGDLADAFRKARANGADGMNVFASPSLSSFFREIIDLAMQHRLPAIYQWREHVDAGGLLSYGPNLTAMWRQAGTIVVKILMGAKPIALPIEQPTKFELAVNARTAKALDIPMQPSVLVSADEVIE
jgi:putative tryptophan/tyrosine transport system substrate-binding protein